MEKRPTVSRENALTWIIFDIYLSKLKYSSERLSLSQDQIVNAVQYRIIFRGVQWIFSISKADSICQDIIKVKVQKRFKNPKMTNSFVHLWLYDAAKVSYHSEDFAWLHLFGCCSIPIQCSSWISLERCWCQSENSQATMATPMAIAGSAPAVSSTMKLAFQLANAFQPSLSSKAKFAAEVDRSRWNCA